MTAELQKLKKATMQGAAWNYATFLSNKGMVFLTTVILARLLAPEDFGLLALGMIAISYLDTIDDLGVSDALVYRQNDPQRAYNVAFFINLGTGSLATLLGFFGAPLAAWFFKEPRVTPLLQALSFSFVLASVGNLLDSRFRKKLDFRTKFFVQVGKALAKGGISIGLALTGFGVWSLVWGQLAGAFAGTLLFWLVSHWVPRWEFDWQIARSLYAYGSQVILVEILGMIHKNIDYLIVGSLLGAEALGFYSMGFRLPELIIINICYIVGQTLFPAYAKLQNDLPQLRQGYLKTIEYLSLVTVPAGALMFIIAPEFVTFFYGSKWQPSIAIVQALSLYALVYSLSYNAGDIYKATGRPVILNQLGLLKLAVTIPALWLAAQQGIFAVAVAQALVTLFLTAVRLFVASRIIGLSLEQLAHAFRPALLASAGMALLAWRLHLSLLKAPPLLSLALVSLTAGGVYLALLWFLERRVLLQAFNTFSGVFLRRKAAL